MRLFIAINFDEQTKNRISAVQNSLRKYAKGSFTRRENLHLTIVFIGEVSQTQAVTIKQAMDEVLVPKMNLTFDHVGYFGKRDGDIWWIGIEKNNELAVLYKQLSQTLHGAGFAMDNREFRPHLTLARRVRAHKYIEPSAILDSSFSTNVDSISLMLSDRVDGTLTYSELYRVSAKA